MRLPDWLQRMVAFAFLYGLANLSCAQTLLQDYPVAQQFFPDAERFTEFQGDPPVATALSGEHVLGYLFRSNDIAPIPAYSGKPINQLVGIDVQAQIVGAKVIEHHEPILLVGIAESRLDDFLAQYRGKRITDRIKVGAGNRPGYTNVDAITGATVTVMVMNEGLLRAGRQIAQSRGLIEGPAVAKLPTQVRNDIFAPHDWDDLTTNGAIRRLLLVRSVVNASFRGTAAEGVEPTPAEAQGDTFIDLYYTYLNAPTIGRNLLGESQFERLMAKLKPGEHAIALLANGSYSFKGSGYVRGGIFDRIQLSQDNREISFRDLDYERLSDVYLPGMPEFSEMAIFIIRDNHQFDPGKNWQLELLVKRQTGPLESVFASFSGEYILPTEYLQPAQATTITTDVEQPIWVQVWQERKFQIFVLTTSLGLLTLIMALQDWLVTFPRAIYFIRTGFQIYTMLFIGWYLLGQLSIVNVFTFTRAVADDFKWDSFLIDPTLFILWTFVAGSLLLWGRGVYCGWLCPFGAIQKLVNDLARRLNIRQFQLPQIIHDRLWGIKYLILLVLFGISLQSLASAERYAEIEPFKTAITLRFDRQWPFVLYALGLIVVSAFNAKFYCKYLCPLGAALAVPAKLSLVNWLRRRRECGKPCQICANECEIQAIHETGEINPNECHYCLDCQMIYWNDRICPPLIERRKRHERARRSQRKTSTADTNLAATKLAAIPIQIQFPPKSAGRETAMLASPVQTKGDTHE